MANVVRLPTDCGDRFYDLAGASGKARVDYRTTIRRLHNVDVDETADDVNSLDDGLQCAHPITLRDIRAMLCEHFAIQSRRLIGLRDGG